MVDALSNEDPLATSNWLRNGGKWCLDYDEHSLEAALHLILESMSLAIEIPYFADGAKHHIGVIHSDVTSDHWGRFNPRDDAWDRQRIKLDI